MVYFVGISRLSPVCSINKGEECVSSFLTLPHHTKFIDGFFIQTTHKELCESQKNPSHDSFRLEGPNNIVDM